jgi:hypothetical protein
MSIRRHVSGERVFNILLQHPEGLSKADIARLTDLSPNQVTVGLVWIREIAASEHTKPIIWTRGNGYQLAPDPDIMHLYEVAQFHARFVSLIRFMRGTTAPHAVLEPENEWLVRANHVLLATCDYLEGLLAKPAQV